MYRINSIIYDIPIRTPRQFERYVNGDKNLVYPCRITKSNINLKEIASNWDGPLKIRKCIRWSELKKYGLI